MKHVSKPFARLCAPLDLGWKARTQAELEIDLTLTHNKLVEVERTISSAREKHNQFLKELGLPPLPGTQNGRE